MSLLIRKPGILSTVQDLGRTGSRRYGINPNGAMDRTAVRLINTLLGNDENAAVIESHFPAVEIEFEHKTTFAIGGGDFAAEMNGRPISNWSCANASRGDILGFRARSSGNRAYIAVKGGLNIEPWLGSRSTNLAAHVGGLDGRALQTGDRLACTESKAGCEPMIGRSIIPRYSRFPTVRIIGGGEFEELTPLSERDVLNSQFALTNDSNRMGFRLSGPPLKLYEPKELVSSAVSFGTVQLLPDGQLVVLMADHQTTGGYPRIGNVIDVDLPLVAQLGPDDKVMFKLVSIEEAEAETLAFERELAFLRIGRRFASE